MKILILVVVCVALSDAVPYMGRNAKNIQITEDGSIMIETPAGKRVVITKPINGGNKDMEIAVSGPNMPTKVIEIAANNQWAGQGVDESDDYLRSKRGSSKIKSTQVDVLTQILKEYQGGVDDVAYEKLLKKINKSVQSGELSSTIYDVLNGLNQIAAIPQQMGAGLNPGLVGSNLVGQEIITPQGVQLEILPQGVAGQALIGQGLLGQNLVGQGIVGEGLLGPGVVRQNLLVSEPGLVNEKLIVLPNGQIVSRRVILNQWLPGSIPPVWQDLIARRLAVQSLNGAGVIGVNQIPLEQNVWQQGQISPIGLYQSGWANQGNGLSQVLQQQQIEREILNSGVVNPGNWQQGQLLQSMPLGNAGGLVGGPVGGNVESLLIQKLLNQKRQEALLGNLIGGNGGVNGQIVPVGVPLSALYGNRV